jgi:ParB-like chromosome segregation protein Spo0J
MIQPATLKAIADSSGKAWSALGPLAGVLVGAYLARSWDRQKWINDNRKDECRELLTSMTMVADVVLEAYIKKGTPYFGDAMNLVWEEERKCMRILQDRIFIAEKLKEGKVRKLWQTVTTDYFEDGDAKKFGARLNEIKAIIIDIALKG